MKLPINKKCFIRILSFSVAFAVALFGGWLHADYKAKKLRQNLIYRYRSSLEEISDGVENISVLLDKSLYIGTPYGMCNLTGELEMLSGVVEGAMASFPNGESSSEKISKFINQVSDFSSVLLKKSVGDEDITDKERTSLKILAESAKKISTGLDEALTVYNNNENWVNRIDDILNGFEIDDDFSAYLDNMTESLSSTPKLIYDGPFSDHIEEKESVLLKNSEEITKEKGAELSAKYLLSDKESLNFAGEEGGKIPAFCFENDNVYISVTKKGGFVKYFRKTRDVENSIITYEAAKNIAIDYIKKNVGENFVPTYYLSEENICVINFAYTTKDVVCYPDLVKIGVALDNGEVVFYEGMGYIMNHTDRNVASPEVSSEDAKDSLSEFLKVKEVKTAIIPSGGGKELLCYEFSCTGETGEEILVYINAVTKREENIFILLKTDGAIVTK